jgi:hypothetical protein
VSHSRATITTASPPVSSEEGPCAIDATVALPPARVANSACSPAPRRSRAVSRARRSAAGYVKIAVEFDGFVPHSSRRVFDDDRVRQNALVADSWRVFRLTKTALERDLESALGPILAALAS